MSDGCIVVTRAEQDSSMRRNSSAASAVSGLRAVPNWMSTPVTESVGPASSGSGSGPGILLPLRFAYHFDMGRPGVDQEDPMAESDDPACAGGWDSRRPLESRRFDWSSYPPSSAVVEAVASVANTDPTDLEPLTAAVDPDALDDLLAPRSDGGNPPLRVSFRYGGYVLELTPDGRLDVLSADVAP